MTTTAPAPATGVQDLIDRIRGEGVQLARQEADRVLKQARDEAAATKAKAEAEARAMVTAARKQVETDRAAGEEAIRNAARDALLNLQNEVRQAFEVHVRKLVSDQTRDSEFVKSLVLILAGEAAQKYVNDKDAVIFVSSYAAGENGPIPQGSLRDKITHAVLGAAAGMLREGIQLMPDERIKGGARVKLVGQDLEIDMSSEALSRMLLKNLLPRYRTIVQEDSGAR